MLTVRRLSETDAPLGRITGSASIDTLVRVGLEKEQLAQTDGLTGLLNQTSFFTQQGGHLRHILLYSCTASSQE